MSEFHNLSRIVKTDNPDEYRYIWDDETELVRPSDYSGFFRGLDGYYYDNALGEQRWNNSLLVVDMFIDAGFSVEPYVPPEPEIKPEE